LTIDQGKNTRNVSYFIIAHAAKFVVPGSVRIGSKGPDDLPQVAFLTPQGKEVVILLNEEKSERQVTIQSGTTQATILIPAGAVATVVL
jgi:glucosylceramidase